MTVQPPANAAPPDFDHTATACYGQRMRLFACSLLLVGCAAADPGYGPTSPTRADAPVAELPPVARALEVDPAPLPEGREDGGHHGHHAHLSTSGGDASASDTGTNTGSNTGTADHAEHGDE